MHIYDVIKRPIVTDKTVDATNKMLLKDAVQNAFDVTVKDVHIMVMPVKTARRGRRLAIRQAKWKKAIVTLVPGNNIQLFEGV